MAKLMTNEWKGARKYKLNKFLIAKCVQGIGQANTVYSDSRQITNAGRRQLNIVGILVDKARDRFEIVIKTKYIRFE